MKRTVLRSDDIACGGCTSSIESALSALAGVKSVAGDPETKIVVVDHDESVTVEALREAMDQIGFSSNVVG